MTKRFISLILTIIMCFSISITSFASDNSTSKENTIEITKFNNIHYYFSSKEGKTIAMSLYENHMLDIFILEEGRLYSTILNLSAPHISSPEEIFSSMVKAIEKKAISFTELFTYSPNTIIRASIDDDIEEALISEYGEPYTTLYPIYYFEDGTFGRISESMSFGAANETSLYLAAGTPISQAAAQIGLSQAELIGVLAQSGSSYLGGVILEALEIGIYHVSVMWTKTVYINGDYQYYAGKETPLLCLKISGFVPLFPRGATITHPDFDNNYALLATGYNIYYS